ncbi:MAG: ABC transporter ATP-binding protein [Proteobacteria bacterium]|nr:ABC transporter ATP-binding protein [Pseudomonadota bacterium]MBU1450298.1 ABC transporter ATP-binding protein [Pseudomonadota bacterium]MBU2516046.1 ABC transporter ATP-binding protein [Pseudomonadota bacterium]
MVGREEIALTGKGLCFGYGDSEIIKDVDLRLDRGELLGIIGPNGSGKSTLLGLLCGLLTPKAGRVELLGRELGSYPRVELARRLGLVPQNAELAPGFTVHQSVLTGRFALMGGRMFEDPSDLAAASQALADTGLTSLAQRRTGELSGGERQRLALARALAAEPQVVLLDEPTSALDLKHQLGIMNLLEKACARDGLAVCLVSHDLNLAGMFCHRLLLLSEGRTLAQGQPSEVLTPELLSRAYGVEVHVDQEPSRKRPRVTLTAPRP